MTERLVKDTMIFLSIPKFHKYFLQESELTPSMPIHKCGQVIDCIAKCKEVINR